MPKSTVIHNKNIKLSEKTQLDGIKWLLELANQEYKGKITKLQKVTAICSAQKRGSRRTYGK